MRVNTARNPEVASSNLAQGTLFDVPRLLSVWVKVLSRAEKPEVCDSDFMCITIQVIEAF
jgi:hypothetical protein